jgi:hypothetical protein
MIYASRWSGFCQVAPEVDLFSRQTVGWRVAASLDALEMGDLVSPLRRTL